MGLFGELFGSFAKGMANGIANGIKEELNKDPIIRFGEEMKYIKSKYKSLDNEKLIDKAYNAEDPVHRGIACDVLNSRGYIMTTWNLQISGEFSIGPDKVKVVDLGCRTMTAHDRATAIKMANERILPEFASKRPELKNFTITSCVNTEWVASIRGFLNNGHSDILTMKLVCGIDDDEEAVKNEFMKEASHRYDNYKNFKIESIHRVIE